MLALLALAQVAATPAPALPNPAAAAADEIVVVARRSTCAVLMRGRELSRRAFDEHVRRWAAGQPVRVAAPDTASYRCLSKILFRLSDRGVRALEFVDPATGER